MSKSRFEDALLALFLQAEAEGRHDTAEHLMRALESLCADPDAAFSSPLAGNGHDTAADQRRSPRAADGLPRRNRAVRRKRCSGG